VRSCLGWPVPGRADATTAAWALLYLPWTLRWWPAALIAAVTFTIAYLSRLSVT
jgi:hypothetical protein